MLDLAALQRSPLVRDPFEFFLTEDVLNDTDLAATRRDFPRVAKPGIYQLASLAYGPAFARLVDDIRSPALRKVMEEKFEVDLAGLPLMITVRGRAQRKDGRIHADSTDKVVTCLLYLNERWDDGGGRLRMLRGSRDLGDYAAEIPPHGGTLAAFKVSPRSWHGHEPYVGERRYIMFNWMRSGGAFRHEVARHRFAALAKRILPSFYKGS